jgi:hypothetical protein
MAPPLPEGAESASKKRISVPDRQRNGQGIAPAFRWREMLENGTYATIAEIAAAERIAIIREHPLPPFDRAAARGKRSRRMGRIASAQCPFFIGARLRAVSTSGAWPWLVRLHVRMPGLELA